ncbi:SCO2400 family protein [Streptomyces sp. NPDC003015]
MVQSTQEDQMDYCSSCRRHLNGALACPGCGAYAPDIAPPSHLLATTGTASAAWDEAPKWHDAGLPEEPATGTDPGVPSEDVADAPVVAEGRAARRRQRARWKKNQRKAVVATAVALVGGGLTVTAMSQQSNTRNQASASPDNRSMGVAELPTSDDALPGAKPATARQASTSTPATKVGSHRRTVDSASTTTRSSSVHTDSATSPTPTATTASRSQSQGTLSTSAAAGTDTGGTSGTTTTTAGTTGTTGTTTGQTSSSSTAGTTTTTTNTGTSASTSGDSSTTAQTGTSSSATDPSGLCVLNLLCIS